MSASIATSFGADDQTDRPYSAALQQYLVFGQGESLFAIDLVAVREVLCLSEQTISPVPNSLPFVLGLTNLRGEILAVGDFGRAIAAEPVDADRPQSRILVIEAPNPEDVRLLPMRFGLAVSHVDGVLSLNPDGIVSAVEVSEELAFLLKGLYDSDGRLVMILDVEALAQSHYW